MTALCPGNGPSGPKPGTDALIYFTGTGIDALLLGTVAPEISAAIAVITAGTTLVTDVLCGADPPADPGLTQTDIQDILTPQDPATFNTARQRVMNWFLHWYWGVVCECTTASTPGISLPPAPTGVGNNTGLPSGNTTGPCWNVKYSANVPAFTGTTGQSDLDLTPFLLPPNPPTLAVVTGGDNLLHVQAQTIPPGANTFALNYTLTPPVQGGQIAECFVQFFTSTGATDNAYGHTSSAGSAGGGGTWGPIPANAVYWAAYASHTNNVQTTFNVTHSFFCSGTGPNNLTTPCCPPDPMVSHYLQLILNIVSNLYTSPPGAPKTGWAAATAHPNISGTGSFQLGSGVTGIRATFTTIPASIRTTPGTPTFYWSLGFVTPVAIDVPLRSLRTVFASQDLALPVQATAIDYTFPAGVVVTLTELVPA